VYLHRDVKIKPVLLKGALLTTIYVNLTTALVVEILPLWPFLIYKTV